MFCLFLSLICDINGFKFVLFGKKILDIIWLILLLNVLNMVIWVFGNFLKIVFKVNFVFVLFFFILVEMILL